MADMLVTGGYKDLGYDTVIIDDCWLDHKRYTQCYRMQHRGVKREYGVLS